jgi:flagellar biosynthetic protein FliR
MLPIVGVLFLINLAVGIITRSAPQLNLFSFGFPITILSVMFLLFLAVSPLAQMFLEVIENHILILSDLFQEVTSGGK